jgi:hypothetical protein
MLRDLKPEDIKIGAIVSPRKVQKNNRLRTSLYLESDGLILEKEYRIKRIEKCIGRCGGCPGRPVIENDIEICGRGSPFDNFYFVEKESDWDE